MGLGGFQPSFCRYIHRNFCKIKGKADQDRIKNDGRKSGILQETFGRLCFRFFPKFRWGCGCCREVYKKLGQVFYTSFFCVQAVQTLPKPRLLGQFSRIKAKDSTAAKPFCLLGYFVRRTILFQGFVQSFTRTGSLTPFPHLWQGRDLRSHCNFRRRRRRNARRRRDSPHPPGHPHR